MCVCVCMSMHTLHTNGYHFKEHSRVNSENRSCLLLSPPLYFVDYLVTCPFEIFLCILFVSVVVFRYFLYTFLVVFTVVMWNCLYEFISFHIRSCVWIIISCFFVFVFSLVALKSAHNIYLNSLWKMLMLS